MSSFSFHLVCGDCGTKSGEYPLWYEAEEPLDLILPAVSTQDRQFSSYVRRLTESERNQFVAGEAVPEKHLLRTPDNGSNDLRFAWPSVSMDGTISISPIPCPACGGCLQAQWGPPRDDSVHPIPVQSVSDAMSLIAKSTKLNVCVLPSKVQLSHTPGFDGEGGQWRVMAPSPESLRGVVEALQNASSVPLHIRMLNETSCYLDEP